MNKPDISLTTLLERIESEAQIADGRTVRLCRDASGNYWVVDGAERVVSLREFAGECRIAAREFCARERAEALRRIATSMKEAFARVVKRLQRPGAKAAHA
jgi:hypothetical protein